MFSMTCRRRPNLFQSGVPLAAISVPYHAPRAPPLLSSPLPLPGKHCAICLDVKQQPACPPCGYNLLPFVSYQLIRSVSGRCLHVAKCLVAGSLFSSGLLCLHRLSGWVELIVRSSLQAYLLLSVPRPCGESKQGVSYLPEEVRREQDHSHLRLIW